MLKTRNFAGDPFLLAVTIPASRPQGVIGGTLPQPLPYTQKKSRQELNLTGILKKDGGYLLSHRIAQYHRRHWA